MRLRVLGCSGGSAAPPAHDIVSARQRLIDAGTGVGDLTLAELSQIDHIFITHSHLDHVTSIPFLVDTVGGALAAAQRVRDTRDHRDPQEPSLQLGDLAGLHRDPEPRGALHALSRRSRWGAR